MNIYLRKFDFVLERLLVIKSFLNVLISDEVWMNLDFKIEAKTLDNCE